jgi:NAD(P)H-hydrate epimerase
MDMKVFTVAEMIAAEKAADAAGVTYDQMMEVAGRRVAEAIQGRMRVAGKRVLVLVGPGNNGGDGLVAGRYLAGAGADVSFYLYRGRDAASDRNYALVQQHGLFVVEAGFDQHFRVLHTRLATTDILLDALLGTGVTRPIVGDLAALLQQVQNRLRKRAQQGAAPPALVSIAGQEIGARWSLAENSSHETQGQPFIVAVDCPSGLNCDSGALDPLTLTAQLTVTFAGPKRGHFRFPGASVCGELVVADIGIAPELPEVAAVPVSLLTAGRARALLPQRPLQGHKGTFGTALIAAGSAHYWGAPVLAARAAYRAGAGLVALAVPAAIRATVAGQLPEATYPPLAAEDVLDAASGRDLRVQASAYASFLLGPGIGPAEAFVQAVLGTNDPDPDESGALPGNLLPPLVIDADGLNVLASIPDWPRLLPPQTILTPHPGEMARLMGADLAEIRRQDRVRLACDQAAEWQVILVLKGAFTVVAAPDGRATLLPFANPLLATGGSGDVLGGAIAGLLAQGMRPFEAAILGCYLHGAAGELARADLGEAGLLAGELADFLPQVRRRLGSAGQGADIGIRHDSGEQP